jgi:hypothetical protein
MLDTNLTFDLNLEGTNSVLNSGLEPINPLNYFTASQNSNFLSTPSLDFAFENWQFHDDGTNGNDLVVRGSADSDRLKGSMDNDKLYGLAGNDWLRGKKATTYLMAVLAVTGW